MATIFSLEPSFSLWGSPYRGGGFLSYSFYIIFAVLAFFILRSRDWEKVWIGAFLTGIAVSFIAIFQKFGLFSETLFSYDYRPVSTLGGANFLALYLLLLSFLALSFSIQKIGKIKLIQIAGFLARRIICDTNKNEKVNKGQRIGKIVLGSQITLILPVKKVKLKIKNGQKVIGGTTIIADLT